MNCPYLKTGVWRLPSSPGFSSWLTQIRLWTTIRRALSQERPYHVSRPC